MSVMTKLNKVVLVFVLFFSFANTYAQSHRIKPDNYFGVVFKPLIPLGIVGDKPFNMVNDEVDLFETKISPIFGYSYGATVRIGITKLLAIETGLGFSKRRYRADYTLTKVDSLNNTSVLKTKDDIGFVNFDIPLNLLVYVQLGKQFYMNVSGGVSMNYYPSEIRSSWTPDEFKKDVFIFEGRRNAHVNFNANAEVGFEYRTDNIGIFYLGMAGRIPFSTIMDIATEYRYDVQSQVSYGKVDGATFALSIKYFFPNIKRDTEFERMQSPTN